MTEIDQSASSTPWWRRRWLVVVAAVLLAGVLAGTALLVLRDDDASGERAAVLDSAALVAARQQATAFFSLDYRRAEADVEKVLSLATGTFKEEYAASSKQVIAQVTEKKLVSTASIPDQGVAVEFVNGDKAQVLVVVDVTRTIGTTTDNLRNRARILLEKVGDRWLVSGVNQVG